jgi:hypothetical protein
VAFVSGEWYGLASRLAADAQVVSAALQASPEPPHPAEAAEFVRGIHQLVARLTEASTRIGLAYRDQLPADVVDQFRTAVTHMRAVSVDHVADALAQLCQQ